MYCKLVSEDEFMHYGVKGMKWGIRRYQNADGSLTNAGKKRLLKAQSSMDMAKARHAVRVRKDKLFEEQMKSNPMDYALVADDYYKRKAKKDKKYQKSIDRMNRRNERKGIDLNKKVKLQINDSDSAVTKRVKKDFNSMNEDQFRNKYHADKLTYYNRVSKYGDPYKHRVNSKSYKALKAYGKSSVGKVLNNATYEMANHSINKGAVKRIRKRQVNKWN